MISPTEFTLRFYVARVDSFQVLDLNFRFVVGFS